MLVWRVSDPHTPFNTSDQPGTGQGELYDVLSSVLFRNMNNKQKGETASRGASKCRGVERESLRALRTAEVSILTGLQQQVISLCRPLFAHDGVHCIPESHAQHSLDNA